MSDAVFYYQVWLQDGFGQSKHCLGIVYHAWFNTPSGACLLLISAWEFPTKQTFTQRGWFPIRCRLEACQCYQNRCNVSGFPRPQSHLVTYKLCQKARECISLWMYSVSCSLCKTSIHMSTIAKFCDSFSHLNFRISSRKAHVDQLQTEQGKRRVWLSGITKNSFPKRGLSVTAYSWNYFTCLPQP